MSADENRVSVPREVILDLLPVYLAGEASPATRALVEAHLAQDPELAERVRNGGEAWPVATPLAPELELQSLRRTRAVLTRLRWLFALAVSTTALSLAIRMRFEGGRITELRPMILDYPWLFGPLMIAAIGFWVAYAAFRRKVRTVAL